MSVLWLEDLLARIAKARVSVVGDFFLDQYWAVEPKLAEISLETQLEANQVVEVRLSPGAAGTVVNNLAALGVGAIRAVGLIGDDGSGYELRRSLERLGVETTFLITAPGRFTPVYTKPMFRGDDGRETEGQRFDIKNRLPTDRAWENALRVALRTVSETSDAVIVLDQVEEEDCGTITAGVREEFAALGESSPELVVLADSRCRIEHFRAVMLKPNRREAQRAFPSSAGDPERMRALFRTAGRPVFMTRGGEGISVFDGERLETVPALELTGPLDPVGAGDSVSAALASALAVGATPFEAARLAVLTASVTIQKIGTTGTASPEEILELARRLVAE